MAGEAKIGRWLRGQESVSTTFLMLSTGEVIVLPQASITGGKMMM